MAVYAYAREIDVTIRIKGENGRPMPHVAAWYDNTGGQIFSDDAGILKLTVTEGTPITLVKENEYMRQVIADREDLTVIMDASCRILGTGFNEFITKRSSTAAVDGAVAADFEGHTQPQIMNALYGLLPGLTVSMSGTEPWPGNSNPSLYVRGKGSFNGNKVLVIVDGTVRDPSTIDVNEVQSVSVLKDAAALAIYGVRGADGAVVITTKRGGDHRFRANVGYRFGMLTPFRVPDMASPSEYAEAYNEARLNDGLAAWYTPTDLKNIAAGQVIPTTRWKDAILRDMGFSHDVHMTLDGSSERTRYFVYADFRSNSGFFNSYNTGLTDGMDTQLEYYSLKLRSNLDIKITRTTDLIINLAARIHQQQTPIGGTGLDFMYNTPTAGIPDRFNGKWVRTELFRNPVGQMMGRGYKSSLERMLQGDITLRQDLSAITQGLKAEIRVAYDNASNTFDQKSFDWSYYIPMEVRNDAGDIAGYRFSQYGNDTEISFNTGISSQYMQSDVWVKLFWDRTFDKHAVKAAALFNRDRLSYTGANQTFVHHDYILAADYSYAGKYLLSIAGTYSGSSKLPKGDKFRFYPAISAGWVISEEDFLRDSRAVDYLKLRGSYGLSGQDNALSYDMDIQFNGEGNKYIFSGSTELKGQTEGALPSYGIEPELEAKADIGVEFGFFGGLTGEVDLFYNHRRNIRTTGTSTVSSVLGIGVGDVFTGETENRGFEVSLGWEQHKGNWSYYLKGNFAFARNRIISINEEYHPYTYMDYRGNSIGTFYGLVADGFYQESDFDSDGKLLSSLPANTFASVQPGDVRYRDLNGDKRIDSYDYTYQLKPYTPEIYYGFRVGLDYKGLGFNAWFQGAGSYTVRTTLPGVYQPLYGGDKNISRHYLESYWSADNTSARYPRLTTMQNTNNYLESSLWTEAGHYFKLRELEIYYRLPEKLMESWKMQDIKVFLRGNNLFSADGIGILDPEYISLGYPVARTFSIGFNMAF